MHVQPNKLWISCSWYKMQTSLSPHFTVNSTNNRIVLDTTVLLSCPLGNQKSFYWLSVIALCPSEWSNFYFTLTKNKRTQSLDPTIAVSLNPAQPTTDATKFNPTQHNRDNSWMDLTHGWTQPMAISERCIARPCSGNIDRSLSIFKRLLGIFFISRY